MSRDLVFSARRIKESGGLSFHRTASVEAFVDRPELGETAGDLLGGAYVSGSCTASLELAVGGESILLGGSVRGTWTLACSRCLGRHEAPFEGTLDETFPADGEIDAGEEVRQAVILCLPTKVLCGAGCKGLCPRCGADLNPGPCACGA